MRLSAKQSRAIRYSLCGFLIILFSILFGASLNTMRQDYSDIMNVPSSRTFDFPININLNGAVGFVDTQLSIGLTLTYPNGSLYVGDNINVAGRAYLSLTGTENISRIAVGFQNAMEYPVFYVLSGVPKQGYLQFDDRHIGEVNEITGQVVTIGYDDVNVTWSMEGDYQPIIGIFYDNGENSTMIAKDAIIHVYPKEQFTEMQTNKITSELAMGAYLFSSLGLASIILQIYPKKRKTVLKK